MIYFLTYFHKIDIKLIAIVSSFFIQRYILNAVLSCYRWDHVDIGNPGVQDSNSPWQNLLRYILGLAYIRIVLIYFLKQNVYFMYLSCFESVSFRFLTIYVFCITMSCYSICFSKWFLCKFTLTPLLILFSMSTCL